MTPHGENHLRRAAELRERVLDFQGQIENLKQAIADAEGAALVLECRAGAQPETHSQKPTKEKP